MFRTRKRQDQDRASRRSFFMQTIRIIPSIPYQSFLFQNCELKNAPLVEALIAGENKN